MTNKTDKNTRLPAEWEAQDGVLLAWPHADSDWQPILAQVVPVFLELTRQISRFEQILIVTPEPEQVTDQLIGAGISLQRVKIYPMATNDTWSRDFGPMTILHDNQPRLLDFGFNAWGLKFAADQDNQITRRLHEAGAFGATTREVSGLILEGGSIESDGAGTLLTTAECLLNPNRNPQLNQAQLEAELKQLLGAEQILWLEHGYLAGDDTDSHIDTLARLCPDQTILYVRCDDPQDEHFTALQLMEKQLQEFRTPSDKPYRLLPLPWPQASYDNEGGRLPATYANYLVINEAVLVPTYADPADTTALQTIAKAFPGREIIPVDCRPLIWQHGSLHCVTMQIPQGVLP
ncbi:MAG TPA: agmatine deiminase family protein [Malonomonas sp.]